VSGKPTPTFHAGADGSSVSIQADARHILHEGASFSVSESVRSLSSAFVHQALLHRLIHSYTFKLTPRRPASIEGGDCLLLVLKNLKKIQHAYQLQRLHGKLGRVEELQRSAALFGRGEMTHQ